MRSAWRKFYTMLSVFYSEMLQYRAEMYLWVLSGIMPFFLMGLWMKASEETGHAMTPVSFARYFLAVFVVRQLTLVWVVYDFEWHVVHGRLSPYLLQPINPAWRFISSHISERGARFPFLIILVGIFFAIYPAALWLPSWHGAILAAFAMVIAFGMRFIMQYTFAMIAFWTERANRIEDLWFMCYLFLSGFIAPLDVFPSTVRSIAMLTPFPYMVYLPAKLLTGNCPEDILVRGFPTMAAWGIAFIFLQRWAWRHGLKHYSAMGA